ncbi:unnamed protein product, partial [Effrenium voratum]
HPHLVTLLGWGQHGLHRYLVYEYLSGGDVFQRLHKCHTGQRTFLWHERLSVLQHAASGLSHLHNSTPKAFHRDIKSANILLDRHGTAKMADFGLACTGRHGAQNVTVKSVGGTPGYKCPIYERSGLCTEGSEVYSFGMVMLEVITGLSPSSTDPKVPGGLTFPIAERVAPNLPGALQRMRRRSAELEMLWQIGRRLSMPRACEMSGYHRHVDCKWQASGAVRRKPTSEPSRTDKLVMTVPVRCTRDDLVEYFGKYGQVLEAKYIGHERYVLHFDSADAVELILQCQEVDEHVIKDIHFKVSKWFAELATDGKRKELPFQASESAKRPKPFGRV